MRYLRVIWIGFLLVVLAGCANLDPDNDEGSGSSSFVILDDYMFTLSTDYISGSYSAVRLNSWEASVNLGTTHGDAGARVFNQEIYVINRLGQDNVQVLNSYKLSVKRQFSVGNGTNPQDIAFVNANKAFVSRYASNDLLIIDPQDGAFLGTVDLSSYADADGICEMANMLIHNGKLYLAVQRLDRDNWFSPVGTSYLVIIDVATNAILGDIPLTGSNPYDLVYSSDSDRILVAEVGNWAVSDGGVEAVDPNSDTALGYLVDETELQGDCSILAVYSDQKAYAIVTDAGFNTSLVSFNPTSGTMIDNAVFAPGGFVLTDIELDSSARIYVTDRTASDPGVRVFDVNTDQEITADPIGVGLPPNVLVFIDH